MSNCAVMNKQTFVSLVFEQVQRKVKILVNHLSVPIALLPMPRPTKPLSLPCANLAELWAWLLARHAVCPSGRRMCPMRRVLGSGAVPMAFAGRASVAKFVMRQKENGKKRKRVRRTDFSAIALQISSTHKSSYSGSYLLQMDENMLMITLSVCWWKKAQQSND